MKTALAAAGVSVTGEASDGQSAVRLNRSLLPDLIIMDFNMPIMNGIDATAAIMADRPAPVFVFSNEMDAKLAFRAIQAGAVDVAAKPDIDQLGNPVYAAAFVAKLKATARTFSLRGRPGSAPSGATGAGAPPLPQPAGDKREVEAVVIGASTGGPAAVRELLCHLPRDFPVGIAIVQHIEERFDAGFAEWLDGESELTVRLARAGDMFRAGEVLVAPGGSHLVCRGRLLQLTDDPPVQSQRPSVDRLFESAAASYRDRLIAILLTGMGADGADGCVKVKNAGGLTLVQDEASSLIFGMPKEAIVRGGASRVLDLREMPFALLAAVGRHG